MPDTRAHRHTRIAMAEAWVATIRDAIRRERLDRRWSLREAAERSDGLMKPSTINAYERGTRQISLTTLHQLAALYQVPVARFLIDHPLIIDGPPLDTSDDRVTRAIEELSNGHRTLLNALALELGRTGERANSSAKGPRR